MKTVYLIRHAKTHAADRFNKDIDRTLNDKGKEQAKKAGQALRDKGFAPDVFLISPAKRAQETAAIIAAENQIDEHALLTDKAIYCAEVDNLMDLLKSPVPR